MLKKILYVIVVIVIIVILAIMWTDTKNKKEAPVESNTSEQLGSTDNSSSINDEVDSINIDSGIDADLNGVDAEINTL